MWAIVKATLAHRDAAARFGNMQNQNVMIDYLIDGWSHLFAYAARSLQLLALGALSILSSLHLAVYGASDEERKIFIPADGSGRVDV